MDKASPGKPKNETEIIKFGQHVLSMIKSKSEIRLIEFVNGYDVTYNLKV